MEQLSSSEIISQYKSGRRDFSGIECTSMDFTNAVLNGIIFRKANLQFCTFNGCELKGADFTDSNLDWAGFKLANLTEARLVRAKCRYALFDDAIFDRADVSEADFSWSRMLNVNFNSANTKGASFVMAAFTLAEMSKDSLGRVAYEISKHKGEIPFELLMEIKFIASGTMDKIGALDMSRQPEGASAGYRGNAGPGYQMGVEGTSAGYSSINPYQMSVRYRSARQYEK